MTVNLWGTQVGFNQEGEFYCDSSIFVRRSIPLILLGIRSQDRSSTAHHSQQYHQTGRQRT